MKRIPLLALALAFIACASVGTKLDADKIASIKPGFTTLAQLEQMFGRPSYEGLDMDGNLTVAWNYAHVQSYVFGADVKNQRLSVLLGADNVVNKFAILDMVNTAAAK